MISMDVVDKLLQKEEEPPPQVVVVVGKQQSVARAMDGDEPQGTHDDHLRNISDRDLKNAMERMRRLILPRFSLNLPDKGVKLKANLKRHENEWERRQRFRPQKDDDGCRKSVQLNDPDSVGISTDSREGAPSSAMSLQSKFAASFLNKLNKKTDSKTVNTFDNKLSALNRCDNRKMRSNGQVPVRPKRGFSSRKAPFRSPGNLIVDVEQQTEPNHDRKARCFTGHSPNSSEAGSIAKRRKASQVQTSYGERHGKGRPVVLDDEEEYEFKEIAHQGNEIDECMTMNIYYPSRDDPKAVEIRYSDMECLAPEAFLTSTIINFYTRYLQELMSPTERHDYHFFNTYFYEKLKDAVQRKNIKKPSFSKLRRWWKGVNIFEKAYIFLPIHESLHWSLVIICIPDKGDESGPILLHLDSLGLHRTKSILSNIKSFLIEEWNSLEGGEDLLDLPIAGSVWERLSRRIDQKEIEVPQQRNDYDCGLFVLFFMQRFIEGAPKRLTKKDLAMFGKRWFCPEEASGLRQKIRELLELKFIEASKEKQSLKN